MALQSSIVGRTLPNFLPCGGTITVLSVSVEPGFVDGLPVISALLQWDTGNPELDAEPTLGSLAPGTALWDALAAAGPIDR